MVRSATKLAIGAASAVNQDGERIGYLTTNAASKLVLGVGRSLDEQLSSHASEVEESNEIMVEPIFGLEDGITKDLKIYYEDVSYSKSLTLIIIYFFLKIQKFINLNVMIVTINKK